MEMTLPHSEEAERSVLGAVFVNNEKLHDLEGLRAEDFYRPVHQKIYRAMQEMMTASQPIDLITVFERLSGDGAFEAAGGSAYLSRLMDGIPSMTNAKHYGAIVIEKSIRRQLIRACADIMTDAQLEGEDAHAVAQRGLDRVASIARTRRAQTHEDLPVVLGHALDEIERRAANGMKLDGVTSGFPDIDNMTDGWHGGDLVTIAAVPSMGKTALGMAMAVNAAKAGTRVLFFSLEMSNKQLGLRTGFAEAGVEARKARTEGLSDHDWSKVADAFRRLQGLPLHLDDTGSLTVAEMSSRTKVLSREKGPVGLVVVDYLGLINGGQRFENRTQEVGAIATALKVMAKDLNIPVIALAQLNRQVAQEQGKRPQLHHLRDSGRVVEDSDVVLLLHREAYYLEREGKQASDDQRLDAEVHIAKQRNGPTGIVHLNFFAKTTSFKSAIRANADPRNRRDLE